MQLAGDGLSESIRDEVKALCSENRELRGGIAEINVEMRLATKYLTGHGEEAPYLGARFSSWNASTASFPFQETLAPSAVEFCRDARSATKPGGAWLATQAVEHDT